MSVYHKKGDQRQVLHSAPNPVPNCSGGRREMGMKFSNSMQACTGEKGRVDSFYKKSLFHPQPGMQRGAKIKELKIERKGERKKRWGERAASHC